MYEVVMVIHKLWKPFKATRDVFANIPMHLEHHVAFNATMHNFYICIFHQIKPPLIHAWKFNSAAKAWRLLLTQIFVNDRKSGAAEQVVASTATCSQPQASQ
jgi:hypothetical protein